MAIGYGPGALNLAGPPPPPNNAHIAHAAAALGLQGAPLPAVAAAAQLSLTAASSSSRSSSSHSSRTATPLPPMKFHETHMNAPPPVPSGPTTKNSCLLRVAGCAVKMNRHCSTPFAVGRLITDEIVDRCISWDGAMMKSPRVQGWYAKHAVLTRFALLIPHIIVSIIKWTIISLAYVIGLIALPIIALIKRDSKYLSAWVYIAMSSILLWIGLSNLGQGIYHSIQGAPLVAQPLFETAGKVLGVSCGFYVLGDLGGVFLPDFYYTPLGQKGLIIRDEMERRKAAAKNPPRGL